MSHPHILGSVGTTFRATIKDQDNVVVNVSGAATKELIFKKPVTGALITKAAAFTTDGTNGKIEYKTVAGDIDEIGTWEWNPHVIISAGNEWYSDPLEFVVKDKLVAT